MFWLLLHLAGYVALATLLPTTAVRVFIKQRAAKQARSHAACMERIAKLELQLRIGLDYGRDWLLSRPIIAAPHMADLVANGNGAVERTCWGCDKEYRPHDEHEGWYKQTPDERQLADRLCRGCYIGATNPEMADFEVAA